MARLDAELGVVIDTSKAVAQLRSLQGSIDSINRSFIATGSTAVAQQAKINSQLLDSAKASGMWTARIVPMTTAIDQFNDSLDRGRMSLGQYTRYATSAMPGMSRIFKTEFEMMTRVAEDRVKRMQTQFVNLGTSVNGVGKALALTPTALDQYASSAAVATQRQMMMNRMIDLGSTKLLNWGKNTQWAGRQLMVGFSIPLAMMGAAAAKAFKEIDQSSIAFRRVYGDLQTTTAEMERNLDAVKELGMEYTKYGQSLAETIDLAAKVAATGAENETLMAATEQTIRLATLGMMEYNEAMDATIALQTAFQVSNEDLAQTIDFLNVVENQTVLSMQDMAAAIPRVAPVVKGLGGDVKDLAVFMTAMREGGISAEQGANALKSGLGRLINPTKAAKEMMADFGISIDAILQRNKGDLMGMVKEFGDALATLGQFEQQQVLQKVFGTYQYARLGALFKNIANDAGQAQRTMELTAMSVEDLAKISERELGRIEEATSVKFAAALERLKVAIAPLGEMFMKILMPIIDRVADVAKAFNDLPSGIKNAIGVGIAAIAGLAPVLIMITGLFGNAIANSIKFVQFMRKGFARIKGNAAAFDNLTMQELEAKAAADALSGSTDILTGKFLGQQRALIGLNALLERYKAGLLSIPGVIPGAGGKGGGGKPGAAPLPFAKGGLVPGRGNRDSIPALLTPGESVVTKEATKQYAPILEAMNRGTLPGFNGGTVPMPSSSSNVMDYLHRSHLLGLQSQEMVDSLRTAWIESSNNPEMRRSLIRTFKTLFGSGGSNIFQDPSTGEYQIGRRGRLKGSSEQPLSEQEVIDRIEEVLGTKEGSKPLTRLNPIGYRGVSVAAKGSKNSIFVESPLLPSSVRGGDALTLSEFKEHKKYAQMVVDAANAGNASLIIDENGNIIGSKDKVVYGKTDAAPRKVKLKGIVAGAGEILTEARSLAARKPPVITDRDFINYRQYQLLATSAADQSKRLTARELKDLEKKLQYRASARTRELERLGIIDKTTGSVDPNKIKTLRGMIAAQAISTPSRAIGLNPLFHRWIGTTLPKSVLSNKQFREKIVASGNLNIGSRRTGSIGRVSQSMAAFLGLPALVKRNSGGIIPGSGNKDTVPALLTPGESVITKEATSKFGPILEAMNRGTIRGFAEAEVAIDEPQTMRGSGAHYTRPKIVRDTEEIRKIIENNIEQAQLLGRSTGEFQTALDELNAGARMQATLFTNAISNIPEIANMDEMTGTEFGRMLADQGNREKMMKPFIEQFAKELGTDAATLRNNPNFIRSVNSIAEEVGTTLAQRGGEFVNTSEFNDAFNAAIDRKIASGEFGPAEAEAARNLRTRKTRVSILADGKEIVSRAPIYGAGVTAYGRGAQESFGTEFLTEEGNAKRRARAEARAARRLAYGQSQRIGATARGAAIPVVNRSDIRQLLEESGLGPAARETQRAESERAATEKARQREIRRQEIISGRRLTQPLGPRVTPQAGPQSRRVVDLGMPGMREGMAAQQEQTQQIKKQSQMLSKLSNAGMMAGFGLMGLTTAASFAGGSIGEMAQKIMPVAGLLSALPMLMNPVGLAITAVGGLTAAMIMGQNHMEDLAKSAADAGANIGGVADSLKILEEATGFTAPTAQDRLFRFTEQDRAAMAEFSSFFEGERGSKFVQDLQKVTSEERYQKVAYILAQGIASGLDPEKAKAFGFAIAEATNDGFLKSNIARDFANNAFGYGADKLIELERNRMRNAPRMERIGNFIPGQTNIYGGTGGAGRGVRAPQFLEGASQLVNNLFQKGSFGAQFFGLQGGKTDQTKALEQGYKVLGFASQQITNLANAEAVLQQQRAEGTISLREYQDQEKQIQDIRKQTTDEMGKIFKLLGTAAPDIRAGFESQLQLAGFDEGQITALLDQIAPEDLAQQIFEKSYLDLSTAQQKYIDEVFARTISGMTPENMNQRLLDIENIWKTVGDRYIGAIESGTLNAAQAATRVGLTQTVAGMLGPGGGGMAAGGQVVGRAEARITQYQAELTNLEMQRDAQQNLVNQIEAAGGAQSQTYKNAKAELDGLNNKIKETQGSILDLEQYISDTDITVAEKIGRNIINTVEKLNQRFSITEQEILNVAAGFKDRKFMQDLLSTEQGVERLAKAMNLLKDYEDINIELVLKTNQDPSTVVRAINEIKNMKLDSKIFGNAAIDADKIVQAFIEMGVKAGLVPGKLEKGVAAVEKFGKAALTSLGTIKPKIMPQIIADVFGTSATTSGQISDALNAAFPSQLSPIDLAIVLSLAGDENAMALLTNPQAIAAAKEGKTMLETTRVVGGETVKSIANLKPIGALSYTGETPGAGKGPGAEKDGGGGGGKSWWQQQLADLKANAKLYGNGANSVIQQLKDLNIPDQLIQAMGTGEEGLKNAQEILRMAEKQPAKFAAEMKKAQKVIGQEALINLGFEPTEEQIRNVKLSLEERKVEKNIIDEIVNSQEYLNIMLYGGKQLQSELVDELRKRQTAEDMINATVAEINKEHEKAIGILDEQIDKQQKIVDGIQEEIDALQKKNEGIQWSIRGKEREKEIIDRQIEKLEYANEMDQRRIQTLQRQDELRNRDADAISRELEAMSDLENQIRNSYQERIDALDRVTQLNDQILQQERQRLGLSQALSQGDIFAATAAAQEMRQSQAEFAKQQVRTGLEQGMEGAIAGLRTSEGLTREQAEARINQIKEQSYQTSLLIRDIEDVIYQRNLDMIPLKDQQYQIDLAIRDLSDQIFNNESEIYRITNERLLTEQQRLTDLEDEKQLRIDVTEEAIKAAEALDDQNLEAKDLAGKLKTIADGWHEINGQISEANRLYRDTMASIGKAPNAAAFATPEEYSAARDKYVADVAAAVARREASVSTARAAGDAAMRATLASGAGTIAGGVAGGSTATPGIGRNRRRRFAGGMINYKGSKEPPPAQMMGGGKVKKYPMGGLIPYADGGKVFGRGGMDSVNAMLTPGEFVVRRAMVDKYGIPMLNALNQGAFGMPRYNVGQPATGNVTVKSQNTSSIVAPMYNNYSVNVSVSGTTASADEIANRTIMKIKQMQDMQIRSGRGY